MTGIKSGEFETLIKILRIIRRRLDKIFLVNTNETIYLLELKCNIQDEMGQCLDRERILVKSEMNDRIRKLEKR